ncbi:MAG: hypothetical protein IT577_18925 [Verrucomicrobiae bacterium]|nr:hypothetical protein [Verrucomicrobiae bacterium]
MPRCAVSGLLLAAPCLCAASQAGFVSVEKDAGVWWFKSPDGKPFVSLGANHVEAVYWQSPNNRQFVADMYGPELISPEGNVREGTPAAAKWGRRVAQNFAAWGLNTLGFHNPLSQSLQSAGSAYYVIELDLHVPWGWNMPRSTLVRAFARNPFDVFGDDFAAAVEANAVAVVKPRAADPRVLGYAYTDGPPWTVDDDHGDEAFRKLSEAGKNVHPWVLAMMSLPATAKGKQAWLALMKERYPASDTAGATYALVATSWDEVAATTQWTTLADAARAAEDSQAFLFKIMRRWYEVRHAAIRKYDRNHLILGDKLNMNRDARHPEELAQSLHAMRPFVNLINIQYYGYFDNQREALALLHRETQMPILNGDTTFTPYWKDPGADAADYYRQLGQDYAGELTKLFALPYFIGWHHCGYMRGLRPPYAAALKRGDRKAAKVFVEGRHTLREGFISESEEPIKPLLEPLIGAWKKCEAVHRAAGDSENAK